MNVHMYTHPAVVHNMARLAERASVCRAGDRSARLWICRQRTSCGTGRNCVCDEQWFASKRELEGKTVLVTAGGTVERLDPVRFLTNDSSGKMGFAIAEAADRGSGCHVDLQHVRAVASALGGIRVIQVESAEEMLEAVLESI